MRNEYRTIRSKLRLRVTDRARLLGDVRRGCAGGNRQDHAKGQRQRNRDQQRGRGTRRAAASGAALRAASPVAEAALNQRHAGPSFVNLVGASVTPLLNSYRVDSE